MKITKIISHILEYDLSEELGYSQQFYQKRSAHLVEIQTDEGVVGWGECFGPGNVAIANKTIVEKVIQPLIIGYDPMNREVIWHRVYNLLRDHGQKGMALQALSGVDIALWDIGGKITGQSISRMIGGRHREKVGVYGYGMMLRKEDLNSLTARFMEEAAVIKLDKLPKSSSAIRIRNRCFITGRPRGNYRKFKLSRIAFRELASDGKLPGITKSSW